MDMDKFPPPPALCIPRQREDGWTPAAQEAFLIALIEHGSVRVAARHVERAVTSAYRLRNRDEVFARAWDAARRMAYSRLRDEAIERAIDGTPEEVWKNGEWVGMKRVRSDRLLLAMLAHLKQEASPHLIKQRAFDDIEDQRGTAMAAHLALVNPPPEPVRLRPRTLKLPAGLPAAAVPPEQSD